MNKNALKFLQAKRSYKEHSFVQKQMAQRLLSLLQERNLHHFEHIFEFGCGMANLSELLIKNLSFQRLILNDINDYGLDFKDNRVKFKAFDMADLAIQTLGRFELVASNATMQWLNFKQSLSDIHKILNNDGFLLFSSFAKGNLQEIKAMTSLSLNYLSVKEMQEILSKKFHILALYEEEICLNFTKAIEVFRHLKLSGVNSLGYIFLSKVFLQEYERKFHNKLTYKAVYFLCKKR